MRAQELLNGVRVGPRGIGGDQRIEEFQEPFRGARWEGVDRMSDNIRMNMLGKVEADGTTARAGTLRIVIGNGRNACEVREAHRHGRGTPPDMWRARERGGFR
jgi:hypothetical protein